MKKLLLKLKYVFLLIFNSDSRTKVIEQNEEPR